ncbi:MAG TPA: hypothetical protein VGD65_07555 [Chryseosolibacter sp.]
MKKTIKRILASSLIVVLVTIFGLVSIILFPKPLFANRLEHGQFVVHSNSEIHGDVKHILDNAADLVKHSELYDPAMKFEIYLSYNTFFNRIDDALIGHGPSARATNQYVTVKVAVDLKRNLFFPTFYQKCQGNLTYLLAHEIVHVLQESTYGKIKFNPIRHPEYWKLEGYPEYIARRTARLSEEYDLVKEIERYVELDRSSVDIWMPVDEGGCKAPKYYYKGRIMTEYLMDIKKLSYDNILADTTSEQVVYEEMLKWKDSTNAKSLQDIDVTDKVQPVQ